MKKKIYFVIVVMTIFVLTGCLGHSSDSNTNDIESKNNDVLKSTQEIRDELKDVALPYMTMRFCLLTIIPKTIRRR